MFKCSQYSKDIVAISFHSSDEVLEFEFTVMNLPSFVLVMSTQKLESLSVNTGIPSRSSDPNFEYRTLEKNEKKER